MKRSLLICLYMSGQNILNAYGTLLIFDTHSHRAVKMAEQLNSKFVLKYYQNLNDIRIISVREKKAEFTRGRIEQNITNAKFFKS